MNAKKPREFYLLVAPDKRPIVMRAGDRAPHAGTLIRVIEDASFPSVTDVNCMSRASEVIMENNDEQR